MVDSEAAVDFLAHECGDYCTGDSDRTTIIAWPAAYCEFDQLECQSLHALVVGPLIGFALMLLDALLLSL